MSFMLHQHNVHMHEILHCRTDKTKIGFLLHNMHKRLKCSIDRAAWRFARKTVF